MNPGATTQPLRCHLSLAQYALCVVVSLDAYAFHPLSVLLVYSVGPCMFDAHLRLEEGPKG